MKVTEKSSDLNTYALFEDLNKIKVFYDKSTDFIAEGSMAKVYKCQIDLEGHEEITYATKVLNT